MRFEADLFALLPSCKKKQTRRDKLLLTGGPNAYESNALPWRGPSWLAASLMALKIPPPPMIDSSSSAAALALFSSPAAAPAAPAAARDEEEDAPPLPARFASAAPSPLELCKGWPLSRAESAPCPDAAEPSGAEPNEDLRFSIDTLVRRLDANGAVSPAACPRGRATRGAWPCCFVVVMSCHCD